MAKKKRKNSNYKTQYINPDMKRRMDRGWKHYEEFMKMVKLRSPIIGSIEDVDFDEDRIARRIKATANVYDETQQYMRTAYPQDPEIIEDLWMGSSLNLHNGYDLKESMYTTGLACAIWMLDQLKKHGRLEEARQLLPQDERIYRDLRMPAVWDSTHDEQTLRGMLWVIYHRNDDCVGLHPNSARFIIDQYTAKGKHRQDVPSRQRFETILAMIPQCEIDQAVTQYEEAYREVLLRTHISTSEYHKAFYMIEKKKYEWALRMSPLAKEYCVGVGDGASSLQNVPEMICQKKDHTDLLLRSEYLFETAQAVEREDNILNLKIGNYNEYIGQCNTVSVKRREQDFTPEVAAVWEDFFVSDPFAVCFAFFYMLDTGSDLPWIYSVSGYLMDICGCELPWFCPEQTQISDGNSEDENLEAGQAASVDWYGRYYENLGIQDPNTRNCRNLAQILYSLTGCMLPRGMDMESVGQALRQYGIRDEAAAQALMHCKRALEEAKDRSRASLVEEEAVDTHTADELMERIRELEAENKRLRQNERTAYHEAETLRRDLEELQAASELDRQELANLRECQYLRNQEEASECEEAAADVTFPYTARKRTVVFGGHDSWAREIKPKLSGVTFVDRHRLPDKNLIRNADVVWLQSNAMNHGTYYRIIDEVRKYNIPVMYFSHASAQKCAEQLALADCG